MEPPMTEESIPELLARLEREHVLSRYQPLEGRKYCLCGQHAPCSAVRLVAHARSLERALTKKNKKRGFPVEGRDPERDALGVERYARS
jgi:hypothetical protein